MMPAKDFMLLMEAERNMKKNFVLSADEMRVVKRYGITQPKMCGRPGCSNELGPRVDGDHRNVNNVDVCEDCYFMDFGDAIELFPIVRRGARGCGHID